MMRRGFTLLEVMVALAIALPALLLLYREGAAALTLTASSQAMQNALSRARSHVAALTASGAVAGERDGDDGGGYRWHTSITTLATAPAPVATSLFAGAVRISWRGPRGEQSVTLQTRLLGPAPAQTP